MPNAVTGPPCERTFFQDRWRCCGPTGLSNTKRACAEVHVCLLVARSGDPLPSFFERPARGRRRRQVRQVHGAKGLVARITPGSAVPTRQPVAAAVIDAAALPASPSPPERNVLA